METISEDRRLYKQITHLNKEKNLLKEVQTLKDKLSYKNILNVELK